MHTKRSNIKKKQNNFSLNNKNKQNKRKKNMPTFPKSEKKDRIYLK